MEENISVLGSLLSFADEMELSSASIGPQPWGRLSTCLDSSVRKRKKSSGLKYSEGADAFIWNRANKAKANSSYEGTDFSDAIKQYWGYPDGEVGAFPDWNRIEQAFEESVRSETTGKQMLLIGDFYRFERKETAAQKWYIRGLKKNQVAAASGNIYAQYSLACQYAYGLGIAQDEVLALHWFRRAAFNGDTRACIMLSNYWASGTLYPADPVMADAWRKTADKKIVLKDTGAVFAPSGDGVSEAEGELSLLEAEEDRLWTVFSQVFNLPPRNRSGSSAAEEPVSEPTSFLGKLMKRLASSSHRNACYDEIPPELMEAMEKTKACRERIAMLKQQKNECMSNQAAIHAMALNDIQMLLGMDFDQAVRYLEENTGRCREKIPLNLEIPLDKLNISYKSEEMLYFVLKQFQREGGFGDEQLAGICVDDLVDLPDENWFRCGYFAQRRGVDFNFAGMCYQKAMEEAPDAPESAEAAFYLSGLYRKEYCTEWVAEKLSAEEIARNQKCFAKAELLYKEAAARGCRRAMDDLHSILTLCWQGDATSVRALARYTADTEIQKFLFFAANQLENRRGKCGDPRNLGFWDGMPTYCTWAACYRLEELYTWRYQQVKGYPPRTPVFPPNPGIYPRRTPGSSKNNDWEFDIHYPPKVSMAHVNILRYRGLAGAKMLHARIRDMECDIRQDEKEEEDAWDRNWGNGGSQAAAQQAEQAQRQADLDAFGSVHDMPDIIIGPGDNLYYRQSIGRFSADYSSGADWVTIHDSDIRIQSATVNGKYFHW